MMYDKMVEEIEQFSKNKLKRKDDLNKLIEISFNNQKIKEFEDLSFTAKYILGLQRVLKKGSINPEIGNIENVKEDYTVNLKKAIEQLKDIVSPAREEVKTYFDKTYLVLSQESLFNLNELLEDLEWTKMYLNKKKRQ